MSTPIKVDIWSDVACPWCYIGKRKFELGVEQFTSHSEGAALEVEVEYHSYELAPDTPVDFEGSETDFLASLKGMAPDQVAQMLANVTAAASQVDLAYDFDALQHTNTVKAHQLLHYAKSHGRQVEMSERLFSAYFVEGKHVGRVADLARLGGEIGLDPADIIRSLDSDEYLGAVQADQLQAQAYGINGVPFFVIDGKYGVSGAQDPSAFRSVLQEVAAHRTGEGATP